MSVLPRQLQAERKPPVSRQSRLTGGLRGGLLCLAALLLSGPLFILPAIAEVPRRIVSLDLCMDWALAHHAEPARVAALSPTLRRYPVDWIGSGWPDHDGSLEQIVQLQPDLVLVGQYSALMLRERSSDSRRARSCSM